jgi:cytochrome c
MNPTQTPENSAMKIQISPAASLMTALAAAILVAATPALAQDVAAAEALAKKSNCMKCHSVSAKKEGPSFKETAAKYKGKADAEATLVKHLTTNPKIKVDGKQEEHDNLKTKNEAEVRNVVKWILAQ